MISLRTPIFFLFFCLASAVPLHAQWNIVGTNEVTGRDRPNSSGGVMYYRDGILWAGYTDLAMSTDSGATWTKVIRPSKSEILDIAFCNKDMGVLTDSSAGVLETTDRGQTWQQIAPFKFCWHIAFGPSPTIIHAADFINSMIHTTLDGGKTWNNITVGGGHVFSFIEAKNGILYALASTPGNSSYYVYSSTDTGLAWTQIPGLVGNDTYSMDIDSCDRNRLYIVNEDYFFYQPNQHSTMYVSPDLGSTWTSTMTILIPGHSGGFASANHAVYAPTVDNGILRSVDQGMNWIDIGGPHVPPDSRTICAVNDNLLFVLDSFGNIWQTRNSGGDTLAISGNSTGGLSVGPQSLFDNDTSICGAILTGAIHYHDSGCAPPVIEGFYQKGPDTASYRILNTADDSLEVIFTSHHAGLQSDTLLLVRSDGLFDTVFLQASGDSSYLLSMTTSDKKTDTLGAEVSVPITVDGFPNPEDVQLTLHYDGDMKYLGSFDSLGNRLDVPGSTSYGISRLDIPNDTPGHTAAWAKFLVFADSSPKPLVTFDSLFIADATTPCEYLSVPAATSIITPPSGCGIPTLSRFIQGEPWNLSISPNPTSGDILIESSHDLKNAALDIFDAMGINRMSKSISLQAANPLLITIPFHPGIYFVRIQSQNGIFTSRVLIEP